MNHARPMQHTDNDLALYLRGFIPSLWTVAAVATALLMLA